MEAVVVGQGFHTNYRLMRSMDVAGTGGKLLFLSGEVCQDINLLTWQQSAEAIVLTNEEGLTVKADEETVRLRGFVESSCLL